MISGGWDEAGWCSGSGGQYSHSPVLALSSVRPITRPLDNHGEAHQGWERDNLAASTVLFTELVTGTC